MLAIRMQRTGRKGHAQFRVVVQDSRRTPTSGRYVAHLGHYNPHTKEAVLNKEQAATYLQNGAQPSERVALLFKKEGIKLPGWVKVSDPKERTTRNPEKLRKNQPAEAAPAAEASEEAAETPSEVEAPAETEQGTPAAETEAAATEEATEDKPAEEASDEAEKA